MAAPPLKARKPTETKPTRPRILVFGRAGVGKTWAALDFPGVYYIDTEGGANLEHYQQKLLQSGGVYLGKEDGSLDYKTVLEQVDALGSQQHEYRTLVIDSISNLFNHTVALEAEKLGDKDQYGASKKEAIKFMRRLITRLEYLDMNVIMIAQEKKDYGSDENLPTFDCWDRLDYYLDLSLYIKKSVTRRIAFIRKSRLLSFPDSDQFPWSYEEFAKRFGQKVIEREATPIELVTPENLEQFLSLKSRIRLDDGQEQKWLDKAGVDRFDQFSNADILKLIQFLEGKLQ